MVFYPRNLVLRMGTLRVAVVVSAWEPQVVYLFPDDSAQEGGQIRIPCFPFGMPETMLGNAELRLG